MYSTWRRSCTKLIWFLPVCLSCLTQYLTHALELKESYKLLKPHVEGLLVQVCCAEQGLPPWVRAEVEARTENSFLTGAAHEGSSDAACRLASSARGYP